ncbi:MAG: sensor histidine kinase [Cyclobacteriaceae bacterium]
MNSRHYLIILIILIYTNAAWSLQTDILLRAYNEAQTYDEKAELGYSYCKSNLYKYPQQCLAIAAEIIAHQSELSDSVMIFNFYNLPGIVYQARNELDSADYFFQRAEKIALAINQEDILLKVRNNIGLVHRARAEYKEAIEVWQYVLTGYKAQANMPFISYVLMNIGSTYYMMENWPLGDQYYEEALQINLDLGDPERIGKSYSALSYGYSSRGKIDSAIFYNEKAISFLEKTNNLYALANAKRSKCADLGLLEEFRKSCECYEEVIELDKKMGNLQGIMISQKNIGTNYINLNRYSLAIKYLDEALRLSNKIGEKRVRQTIHSSLAKAYFNSNKFREAYLHADSSQVLEDTLRGSEIQEQLSELNVKYETAQKEQEITEQKLEIAEQETTIQWKRFQVYGLIGGLVIVLLAGFIFYNQYKNKQQRKLQAAILQEKERGFETVLTATEEERSRISKELHDGIGQQLSALKLGLQSVSKSIGDENQRKQLDEIATSFSKSAEEVRHISHQMMPRALMEKGLVEAIEDLLQSSFQYTDTTYSFEHHNITGRFEERIEVSIYRVIQELINNIIKHAGAQTVTVQLIKQKGNLLLFLEDNGKGMNEESTKGHGLLNIKSRLDMINGSVDYAPSPESGTSVTIKIPIV